MLGVSQTCSHLSVLERDLAQIVDIFRAVEFGDARVPRCVIARGGVQQHLSLARISPRWRGPR